MPLCLQEQGTPGLPLQADSSKWWLVSGCRRGRSAEELQHLTDPGVATGQNAAICPKREHTEYINGKEDVWFTEDTTEVLLRIAPEVAHYFLRRALLPHQQQRQDRDGSLLVSTHVNHMYQLLPVVRYWLPHVRILQPCGMASGAGRQLAPRFAAVGRGISVKEAISPCLAPRKKRCS